VGTDWAIDSAEQVKADIGSMGFGGFEHWDRGKNVKLGMDGF
jgi:hypothetical protein